MFKKTVNNDAQLTEAITDVHALMSKTPPNTESYAAMVDQLVKLHSLKTPSRMPSTDQMVAITAHLAGVGMIVGYERANVITTKALTFVTKLF